MNWRLLMTGAAARRSAVPAGMSGWCMCSAMAKAERIRAKSIRLSGRNSGIAPAIASEIAGSAPLRLGKLEAEFGSRSDIGQDPTSRAPALANTHDLPLDDR